MIDTRFIYICAAAALLVFFTPLTSDQYLVLLALGLFCFIGPLSRELLGEDFWGTMGQAQSQAESVQAPDRVQQRTGPVEDPAVVAERNKEERARRAAAAEARFHSTAKPNSELGRKLAAQKKKSALQQASDENRGWRAADEMRDARSYN